MKRAMMLLAWTLMVMPAFGQYTITGVIVDEKDHPLPGANLFIPELSRGAVALSDGSFSLVRMPEGDYHLKVTFVGYEAHDEALHLTSDQYLGKISLTRDAIMGGKSVV